RSMKTLASDHDARMIAVLFPERSQVENYDRWGLPYQKAKESLERAGIPYASGLEAIEAALQEDPTVSIDDFYLDGDNIHFTPYGHRVMAAALAPLLAEFLEIERSLSISAKKAPRGRATNDPYRFDWNEDSESGGAAIE
ncbi:MAG: hypothetical protein ACX98W_06420, partial [bacterium]